MTDPAEPRQDATEPGFMHRRYPYGPFHARLVTPVVAIIAGAFLAIRSVGGLGASGHGNTTTLFVLSLVVIVLGIIAIPLARWMAKRGH